MAFMKKGKSTKKKLQPYEIGELDQYLFGQGNHYEIYQKMGAHKVTYNGKEGVYFAVWGTPCAQGCGGRRFQWLGL